MAARHRQVTLFQFKKNTNILKAIVMNPDCSVSFVEHLPPKHVRPFAVVTPRGLGDIMLYDLHDATPEPIPPGGNVLDDRAVPFLKSQIQKAVRRNKTTAALEAAWSLLYLDHEALWRRLPIIMMEDTRMTDDFQLLVFGMLAASTKKWVASAQVLDRLQRVVEAMCGHAQAEDLTFRDSRPTVTEISDVADSRKRALGWAIMVRHLYGGLKGDGTMLSGFVHAQLPSPEWHIEPGVTPFGKPARRPAFITSKGQCLLEAVDFHCYPMILEKLQGQRGTPDTIKSLMWLGRSSRNNRRPETMASTYTLQDVHDAEAISFIDRLFWKRK